MTGLDNRENRFLERVREYRKRMRECVRRPYEIAENREVDADELERDLDGLLMEAANLAREPMLRHMSKAMEAAATLAPSPFTTYPDPRKGAVAVEPTHTPDAINVLTRMVTDYLTPEPYASRFGGLHRLPAGSLHWQGPHRMSAFVNDVVHLVDNPAHIKPKEPGQ